MHKFFAAGDKLAKLDRKLLHRKSREDTFLEINKKKVGEETAILLIRNPSPGLAFLDKVTSVSHKSIPSAIVYYYCAWYTFI